jgi:hypothetical protein
MSVLQEVPCVKLNGFHFLQSFVFAHTGAAAFVKVKYVTDFRSLQTTH